MFFAIFGVFFLQLYTTLRILQKLRLYALIYSSHGLYLHLIGFCLIGTIRLIVVYLNSLIFFVYHQTLFCLLYKEVAPNHIYRQA